jgi:thiamine biosynthesis lipoprotein
LGKAYIVDRAAEAARLAAPNAQSLILDIGGDIRVFGEARLGIADPADPAENALPLTHVRLANGAVATSGSYARGAHIFDPRTGLAAQGARAASVTAPDCVTANALSTALCVLSPSEGISLLDATPEAEGLLVTSQGGVLRSSGFRRFEEARSRSVAYAGWPNGHQVSITFTLKDPEPQGAPKGGGFGGKGGGFGGRGGGRLRRPYVAVWAEDTNGAVVRNIALWASKPRWIAELRTWWRKNGTSAQAATRIARATRDAGQYTLTWNGQNDSGEPVPAGTYKIWIETNREHGTHYESSALIDCSAKASTAEMKATAEFADIKVEFGPAGATV